MELAIAMLAVWLLVRSWAREEKECYRTKLGEDPPWCQVLGEDGADAFPAWYPRSSAAHTRMLHSPQRRGVHVSLPKPRDVRLQGREVYKLCAEVLARAALLDPGKPGGGAPSPCRVNPCEEQRAVQELRVAEAEEEEGQGGGGSKAAKSRPLSRLEEFPNREPSEA